MNDERATETTDPKPCKKCSLPELCNGGRDCAPMEGAGGRMTVSDDSTTGTTPATKRPHLDEAIFRIRAQIEDDCSRDDDEVLVYAGHARALLDEIDRLRAALRELEDANEELCAGRSQAAYDAMVTSGQSDSLLRLDRARRAATELLS